MTALIRTSTTSGIGLSVGTSTLAAVTLDRTVTSRPVITRAGFPIDDFVARVGDPVGIVAADGSRHSSAALLADALHELSRSATAGRPLPAAATIAYPAHWQPVAVDALSRALRRIPVWSAGVELVPDYAAALSAVQNESRLPANGVIAVCDFGAGATTFTLVDAANSLSSIGEPVRCAEFSGDLIDRALLTHVLTAAGIGPDATGTWSIRALTTLREECRHAKERLSAQTVTTVPGAPAGVRGSIRISRPELDELVGGPLTEVVGALRDSLQRNGIPLTDLAAIVAVGGTATVPAVSATLSAQLRAPIVTVARPALAAATGAALRAPKPAAGASAITRVHPAPPERESEPAAVAWSQAADVPEIVPQHSVWAKRRPARPQLEFGSAPAVPTRTPWHRRPVVLAALVLAVIAGAGTATALALRSDTAAAPAVSPVTPARDASQDPPSPRMVVAIPAAGAPEQQPAPAEPAVVPSVVEPPPAAEPPSMAEPAPIATPAPAPPPVEPAPSPAAPVTEVATETPAAPAAAPIPALPTIPQIPIPQITIPPIPGLPDLPTLFPPLPPSG